MIIHWIIVIAMTYVAYVVFKNIWSDNDASHQKNDCRCNCQCNCANTQKNSTQPKYTYTATENKSTSTT